MGTLIRKIGRHPRPETSGAGEHAAQDRSGDAAQRHDGAVEAERLGTGAFVEGHVQRGQDLGNHDRRGTALDEAGGDQHGGCAGQAAEQRRRGEDAGPQEEEPLAAVEIAEPAAGDQPNGEGQRVGGVNPLHRGARGTGVVLNGGQGRVDDGAVESVHQLRDQDDDQHDGATTAWPAAGGGGAGGEGFGVSGHDTVPVLADSKGKGAGQACPSRLLRGDRKIGYGNAQAERQTSAERRPRAAAQSRGSSLTASGSQAWEVGHHLVTYTSGADSSVSDPRLRS